MDVNKQKLTLERCGITDIDIVGDGLVARLDGFKFRFNNYYWVVNGKMPILQANELYYCSVVGKKDIRCSGQAGGIEPHEVTEWFTWDGKQCLPLAEKDNFKKFEYLGGDFAPERVEQKYVFGNPELCETKGFITSYHVDSELALYILVQVIRSL